MDAYVSVRNLEKTYAGGVQALAGISFEIRPGELMGLLGPNGAGKTTTVKILSGLVAPTAGEARLLGRPASDPEARAALGYLPERASPPEHLTGLEVLDREGRLHGLERGERVRRTARLLDRVQLPEHVSRRKVATYSKGERGRLGIASALVNDPRIVLLDEPTDGLDPIGRTQVRDLLVELKKEGRAILLNSHLLSEAELCCDHVAIISFGRVAAAGKIEELLSREHTELTLRTVPAPSPEDLAQLRQLARSVAPEGENLLVHLHAAADVDRLVDAIRARGLSLRELTPKKQSLEAFFLEAVQQGKRP